MSEPTEQVIQRIVEDALVAARFGFVPFDDEKHLATEAASRIVAYLKLADLLADVSTVAPKRTAD